MTYHFLILADIEPLKHREIDLFLIVFSSILAFILLVILILSFIFAYKKKRPNKEGTDFNIRAYTYDYIKKSYFFVDLKNMTNQKTYNEEQFYNQFIPSDRYRVQNWLDDIIKKDEYHKFLQADIHVNSKHKNMTSVMEIKSINKEKGKIHFESSFLPNLSSSFNFSGHKTVSNRKLKRFLLDDIHEAQEFIDSAPSNQIVGIYYLKLYRQTRKDFEKDDYLQKVSSKLTEPIGHLLSKEIRYFRPNDIDYVIVDLNSVSKAMVMNVASSISTTIQKSINTAFPDADITLGIGITFGYICQRNFSSALEQSSTISSLIADNYTKEKFIIYDKETINNYNITKKNLQDITMVIKNTTLRVYFQPTLNIKTGKNSFYIIKPKPYGTSIEDFSEVLKLASKTQLGTAPLFRYIQTKATQILRNIDNSGVLLEISFTDVNSFLKAINDSPSDSNLDWIVAFEEIDLLSYVNNIQTIRKAFQQLLECECKIAISIRNANTALPASVLRFASYFIIGKSFTGNLNNDKVRNGLRLIQSNLNSYPASLVYFGLADYNSFELAVHYGAQILECAQLAGVSSHAEVLNPEKVEYLLKDTANLRPKNKSDIPHYIPFSKMKNTKIPTPTKAESVNKNSTRRK
ncbi:MAG: hypothetical protein WCR67_06625 [Bacilli bacterium]